MIRSVSLIAIVAVAVCALGAVHPHAQQAPPVDRAKQVLQLLVEGKVEDVASQFNAQMAAALTPAQMRGVWATVTEQAGKFTSYIDDQVLTPAEGMTAVVLGCQFDKAAVNFVVAFDAENKIAGLRVNPRPAQ
jgi:hypothetical protein